MAVSKYTRFYRILKLLKGSLGAIIDWFDEFRPEWEKEDEEAKLVAEKLKASATSTTKANEDPTMDR